MSLFQATPIQKIFAPSAQYTTLVFPRILSELGSHGYNPANGEWTPVPSTELKPRRCNLSGQLWLSGGVSVVQPNIVAKLSTYNVPRPDRYPDIATGMGNLRLDFPGTAMISLAFNFVAYPGEAFVLRLYVDAIMTLNPVTCFDWRAGPSQPFWYSNAGLGTVQLDENPAHTFISGLVLTS